jgi:hypothetical protein
MPDTRLPPALDTALRVLQTAVDMPREWDARLTPVQAAAVLEDRETILRERTQAVQREAQARIALADVQAQLVALNVRVTTLARAHTGSTPAAGHAAHTDHR